MTQERQRPAVTNLCASGPRTLNPVPHGGQTAMSTQTITATFTDYEWSAPDTVAFTVTVTANDDWNEQLFGLAWYTPNPNDHDAEFQIKIDLEQVRPSAASGEALELLSDGTVVALLPLPQGVNAADAAAAINAAAHEIAELALPARPPHAD